ncbi:hypothetical protein CONCODRAFT_16199 [Conidiobolus coronatus NRRL 28638]|uniref:Transcription factor domain-containing protein n=1 Tax=Conidiobolus coronatus (strain ATCC 28846 / CBS 209.66 / NRRL 28638) TaxID=796925 RepID=A0A137PBL9_CONC2|nr:hypothetical protein CONCODRAFT_16199 [Conidiobolus coronatus NRRL 28638]|eukprot:KXN72356.1 hypothetical protein CONCODRAFT_16199 [Conidiobolus coronatus NRRL 28638]
MKDHLKFIAYKDCFKCMESSTKLCSYYSKYNQVQRVENQKFPSITVSKFLSYYYKDKSDINFWSQLKFQRFSSIEHLTSYILNSDNIQASQLVGECKWDLGKLPQIKHLVSENEDLLANTPDIDSRIGKVCSNSLKIIQIIFNTNIWGKLIHTYIIHYHRYEAIFYLKDFDLNTIPQSLLNAIYCLGYIYFDQKSDHLTQYMDQLGNINYKMIKFKPSLTNIQALFIHQYILYSQGKITEARSCLLHITKMCYILGFHRNTTKLSKSTINTRNLVYTKVLYLHLTMTKVHKVNLNFQIDLPDINKICYNREWQLLPKETAQKISLKEEEITLISTLTNLENQFIDRSRLHLIFPSVESYTNDQIYKICIEKCYSLRLSHSIYISGYELLSNSYPEYSELIEFDREAFEAYTLVLSILIFEYGRSKSKGINHSIVRKMMNLCEELIMIALTRDTGYFLQYDIYTTVFTCVKLFKYLRQSQQTKLISNLTVVKKILSNNLSSSNLLIYLLFDKSLELIKKL